MESYLLDSSQHFSLKYFLDNAFVQKKHSQNSKDKFGHLIREIGRNDWIKDVGWLIMLKEPRQSDSLQMMLRTWQISTYYENGV